MKRAWESVEAGRAAKAMVARGQFLKSNLVRVDGPMTDDEYEKLPDDDQILSQGTQQAILSTSASIAQPKQVQIDPKKLKLPEDPKAAVKPVTKVKKDKEKPETTSKSQDPQSNETAVDQFIQQISSTNDEVLLNRPPTPPKPKVFLPPIDIAPFVKSRSNAIIFKNENFEKEEEEIRKNEVNKFLLFKEQILKFREEERKYRLYQKMKQIEEYEILQVSIY